MHVILDTEKLVIVTDEKGEALKFASYDEADEFASENVEFYQTVYVS